MRKCLVLAAVLASVLVNGQSFDFAEKAREDRWVDSVFSALSPRDRVAQLMIIRVPTPKDATGTEKLMKEMASLRPGGVTFFAGDPETELLLTNRMQKEAKVPVLVSIDGEWGLAMRLSNTIAFPYQMTLGAIQDDSLIYAMGEEIARQCRRMGIHINFAPVVDINNNPANPVINYRSFGENRWNVAKKGLMYAKGMEDNGVLSSIKHFPGHGDTGVDSHYALPVISHSRARLDSLELFPFKYLIEQNVSGIMVGHLNIPAMESDPNRASSLSRNIVQGEIRDKYKFGGIIMTDALEMKGVASHFAAGQAAVESFKAGNDILLLPEDPSAALDAIEAEIKKGGIKRTEVDERVRKILALKYRLGLHQDQQQPLEGLLEDLNSPSAHLLKRNLLEASLTAVTNDGILPFKDLDKRSIAVVSVGVTGNTPFQEGMSRYTRTTSYVVGPKAEGAEALRAQRSNHNTWVIALHETQSRPRNNELYSPEVYNLINEISGWGETVVVVFRNAYTLSYLASAEAVNALVVAYQDDADVEDLASQALFGGVDVSGRLPVGVGNFTEGAGVDIKGGIRFKYTLPEELGLDSKELERRVDAIMAEGIDSAAFPGGQVLFAKDKKVFFHKTYGYHSYRKELPVSKNDLYDFASVTKISTSTAALMTLYDKGLFDLDGTMGEDIPMLARSNKKDLEWRRVLTHTSGLKSWIPFWTTTINKKGGYKRNTLSDQYSEKYSYKLSDSVYMVPEYKKQLMKQIKKSPVKPEQGYVYSDLSFYLYPELVERKTGRQFENYLKEDIYRKLGAYSLTFNPTREFTLDQIVPTERDTFFRKVQLHGYVHDEGAIMMGGISGHAGLFGQAGDLAKLMQMYLDMGVYGGDRYISENTLNLFTACQYCNEGVHRGIGFDKPLLERKERGTHAPSASYRSFGHSGYTGTFTWADPENGLLYVFFSNRVNPTRLNTKIATMNLRPRVHQVVYDMLSEIE